MYINIYIYYIYMYNTVHMYINVKCIYIYIYIEIVYVILAILSTAINVDVEDLWISVESTGSSIQTTTLLEGGQQPLTKKFQHAPEAPGHPVSMLLIITSQWPEQERLFFEGSAKRCFHTTLKLGDQGCLTVLARVQVGWLFFLKNPVWFIWS